MNKNKLFVCLVFLVLGVFSILPVCAEQSQPTANENSGSKSELKHVLAKFAIAMSVVGGSCLVLYLGLRTYKRFKDKEDNTQISYIDVNKNLYTPETIDEATKLFIEKF